MVAQMVKNLTAIGKIPRRRKWQPTPEFLLGKFHGQRNLEGHSPWGCKESDMTKQLTLKRNICKLTIKSQKRTKEGTRSTE